ncbi:MAG: hypothetical protein V3R20_02495 [Sphingomonadales bacterium]
MKTYKTYLFSAMALGTIGASFIATEALADHREGRGRGYGKQVVDLYIDAGDRQLERAIGKHLQASNPYINIVYSRRYADVTVWVNGAMSTPEIYDRRGRRARSGYASMAYDYKIRIKAGGKTIYRDRIYGEVTQPLGRRDRYHNNSAGKIEKAERAVELLGVFLGTINGDGYGVRYRNGGAGNIVPQLRIKAIERIADSFGHIKIPRRLARYRR